MTKTVEKLLSINRSCSVLYTVLCPVLVPSTLGDGGLMTAAGDVSPGPLCTAR